MTVEQTENGLVCRWWEGTKERTRYFHGWQAITDYMCGIVRAPTADGPHPMMAEAIRAADCRGDY
ncbi:MAG: hypothetical protein KGL35_05410 [Bradyrhizobium sp.]|nr:hypothetical protein [Bradyrhizobium sp.]